MNVEQGQVAVVTGAAGGIGLALAQHAAKLGVRLVLADIDEAALAAVSAELAAHTDVTTVVGDVSQEAHVQALADTAMATYGQVNLLFNNAGVGHNGLVWETRTSDWEWVMGVNLWGVIHGCRIFSQLMLDQGLPSHIVNTASMAGITTGGALSIYNVTKQGVVALSETLYHDLRMAQATHVGVSVLCPGWVKTDIWRSERNRPEEERSPLDKSDAANAVAQAVGYLVMTGISAESVAETTFNAIENDEFYILTHRDWTPSIERRFQAMLENKPPHNPLKG